MWLLLACVGPSGPVESPEDSKVLGAPDSAADSDSPADSPDDSGPMPLSADYLFDGVATPEPLLGFGGQVWAGDTAWEPALDMFDARLVRIAINANLGSAAVDLPVDVAAAEWDAWMAVHIQDQAPSFLQDLLDAQGAFDTRSMTWIAHQWEAPPTWETAGVLRSEHVDDFAAMTAALYRWLHDNGVRPTWIELTNEPDGDWNSYITPDDYSDLVVATRAALDDAGLTDTRILGPGLAVLGGWTDPPLWVPSLADDAVAALDGWSVHTWDDYAENGEGHAFLAARWQIFVAQIEARDPTKPIIVTEMGSKDTVFDGATYLTPDSTGCGAASEADGYAIRMLAHVAVALTMGADGISFWESADQTWQCSNWGMVDTEGDARRYLEALAMFTTALPADGGTVLAPSADLPAVAVLGASGGAVLVVNDSGERVSRTVAVTGGWSLVESRGFATSDRLLRDELADLNQTITDANVAIDVQNAAYFDSDFARAYRSTDADAAMVWTPGGDLVSAEIVAWSWTGADAVPPRVEASVDGSDWQPLSSTEVRSVLGWNRHAVQIPSFPAGSRSLRVTLPVNASPAWSPQLGDVSLRWTLDAPAALPSGEAPWTVDLPAGSAVVLVLRR